MACSVLVISSDPLFSHLIVKSLAREDIRAHSTNSFIEALNALSTVETVIVDMSFARIDPTGLVRALSSRSDVPILAMSEDTSPAARLAVIDAGAWDATGKAYLPDELVARVRLLLEARRERPREAVAA